MLSMSRRAAIAAGLSALATPALVTPALARRVELPQEAGVFVARVDGTLQALEAQLPQTGMRFAVFGMKIALVFKGARSPVRFRAGQALSFLVLMNGEANSMTPPVLWRARVDKASRRVELGYATDFTAEMTGSPDIVTTGRTVFDNKGMVEVRAYDPLPPGEYVLGIKSQGGDAVSGMAYAFGVDS